MGILLALLGTFYQGKTYGTGYHEAAAALKGAYEAPIGLAAAKWAATVFSYWAGIPGGIFTPSLTIGAMIGEHMASFVQLGDASNVAVLLCMAAFLAAATQSPLTAAVVVMEMTGGQNLLFWMLLTCIFASQVSRQFSPHPFYHAAGLRSDGILKPKRTCSAREKRIGRHIKGRLKIDFRRPLLCRLKLYFSFT